MIKLNKEQEEMLAGKEGRGAQKAMEILTAMGNAIGAGEMVKISYAHLMPPDLMFFPYGKQGEWAHDMTRELTQDLKGLKVPATIEPKFCDLHIAKDLQFTDEIIEEMRIIQGNAVNFYENLGVYTTYSAMPFLYYQTKLGRHVSIAESIATLWFNTMFGSRCERDDGVTALSAAITGYVPLAGRKINKDVTLVVSTTRLLLQQAEDIGYADVIRDAGGVISKYMCIAFAGTNVKGTIATNSIKAVFFYAGFCASEPNGVKFGSIKECARSALTGKWEGRF